jgi:hypothetical protein
MKTAHVLVFLSALLLACGAGAKVCAVVDLAQHACTVLRYLEEDGTVHEVRVTPEEAREFARAVSKKRASEKLDGGAP